MINKAPDSPIYAWNAVVDWGTKNSYTRTILTVEATTKAEAKRVIKSYIKVQKIHGIYEA